jgi:uncharacterized membrane protein
LISVVGATAGPLGGVFLMGILIPHTSRLGAFLSLIISESAMIYMAVTMYIHHPYSAYNLPVSVDKCEGLLQ